MLDDRALNRALLARQHLLARTSDDVTTVVTHLVGLQAQNPWSPFLGLWSRVEGFATTDLDALLLDRTLVRLAVMRSTVHLVTARDAPTLAALTRPVLAREITANPRRREAAAATDLAELAAHAAAYLHASPRPTTELGAHLAERWPQAHPQDLSSFARALLPLVQVTPRGLWRRSAATTWTTLDTWAPEHAASVPSGPEEHRRAVEDLVLRYLAAYGPANAADVQRWSGLRGLREVLDALSDRLVVLPAVDDDGREHLLLDLPDAPRPDPGTPAPVRLLPDYDNLWLAHARRSRVVADEHRRALQRPNGVVPSSVLVDGRVRGTWRLLRESHGARGARRTTAALVVDPLEPLTRAERADVLAEAERCVRLVGDDADAHEVRIAG